MASTKKPKGIPTVPAEIFYFSDEGGCSRSTKWASPEMNSWQAPTKGECADRLAGAARTLPGQIDGSHSRGAVPHPDVPVPPPLSKLAERVGRSERTRAAKATSLKGPMQSQKKLPALPSARRDQSAMAEAAMEGQPVDTLEAPAPPACENAEKTESFDLQQMPILELDASDLAETDLDADDLEEIEPESTLVEDLSDDGEAANVEAEFARALSEVPCEVAQTSPRTSPVLAVAQSERSPRPEALQSRPGSVDFDRAIGGATDRSPAPSPTMPGEGILADAALCLLKSAQAQQHYRQKLAPLLTKGGSVSPERAWASAALFGQDLFATGRPLPARKLFERLIAQEPTESFPYAMLASLHLAQGNDEEALTLYEQALEIDPTDLCALLGRAEIHLRAADPVEALVDVKTAINQATLDESPLLVRAQAMMDAVQQLIGFLG